MSDIPDLRAADEGDLFRWMVAASPDGLWVIDGDGRTVFANDRMARMLGLTAAEAVGFSVFDAVDEQGKKDFASHLAERARTGLPGDNLECSLIDRQGNRFWALVSHSPMVDEQGRTRGWLYRVSEHSAQRQLLDQLAEAQSIAKIGSWGWDVGRDRVWWSDELYRIYGLEPGWLTPTYEGFLAHIHPDDRALVSEAVGAAVQSEDSFEFDARVVRGSGDIVWIRGRGLVSRDGSGRAVRMNGTTQDITAVKDAEQALGLLSAMATAANESATLAELLPAVLAEVARHTTWRPVLATIVDEDGVLGAPVPVPDGTETSVVPEAVGFEVAARAAASLVVETATSAQGSTVVAVPVVNEGRLACVVVLDMRGITQPVETDERTIGQTVALVARVADREWTAEHLARARDAAMEASRAKSAFLATMSHEIRTPLNGVIGLSELLGRTELSPHQRRLSDGIDQAGRVLLGLVNDILDLSKIEAGRLELESVDFDPAAVLERGVALLAERARAKSVDLSVTHGPDLPFLVSGDPVRFGQVVANLTTNAVKFTDCGSVSVHLSLEHGGGAGPVLRVEVTDTGAGITPEVRSRLFESFSQGDSSTTRQYGGTGLGLAISKQIVAALGGEIGVDSEPGEGSTFWFTAAFAPASGRTVGRSASRVAAVTGLRALVVGPNEPHRTRISEQLTAWAMTVASASSGLEGLVQLDRAHRGDTPFDVIVLDDPGSGFACLEVVRMIRADERFEQLRVVLVCAQAPLPDPESLADAGVDATLTAPVMPSALFDAMVDVAGSQLVPADAAVDAGDAERDAGRAGEGDPEKGRHGLVLVVEDNEVNQLVAQGVLESLGYAVVLASNGVEGVAAHRERADDLVAVLMDCQMPQMDGYEATRLIRAHERPGRRLPVVAMTASAIAGERERCLRAGMDDFLTKPVDVTLLAATLQRWTGSGPTSSRRVDPPSVAEDDGLDHARLEELRDLEPGDPSLLLRFLDRFADSARQRLAELVAAHAAGDAEGAGRIAHGLKGSASNLGASALAEVCREVEEQGADGRLADEALVARVERELSRASEALDAYAAGLRQVVFVPPEA
ncbi:response regulator [Terrabacter sp. NPDC000476]|uniref:response regulator n=1 Tax=Terrabacter sp. NPDC000476 TaxID=3154258 RepID=UPI003323EB8C